MENAKKQNTATYPRNIYLIGTQTGKCQLCRQIKKLFLLKYGFSLCEDCLGMCTSILEELQREQENSKKTSATCKTKEKKTLKKSLKKKRAVGLAEKVKYAQKTKVLT